MSLARAKSNPLLLAAQYRQAELIASLLEHRIEPAPSLSERSSEDGSILGYALQIDRSADTASVARIVACLIERGASPDSVEPDMIAGTHYNYATARHERDRRHMAEIAARRPEELGSLIFNALGPERLKALSDELPILHIAVSSNQLWAARALLNAGADPNRDHPGRGLAAAKVSGCEMLGVLISHGAKLTQRDAQGNYPLQALASSRCESRLLDLAMAASEAEANGQRLNLASPTSPNRPKKGQPAAAPLVQGLFEAIENRQKENIASLWEALGRKSALAARDASGRNVLHAAIAGRQWALAKRLLNAGVDPNAFDASGQSPLSLFIGLPYKNEEKDRKGRHRHLMRDALMSRVKWDAKDESGRGYPEALWSVCWEPKNDLYASSWQTEIWGAPSFDPLERGPDGLCFIERVLPQWSAAKGSFEYYHPASSILPLETLMSQAFEKGRVDAALASRFLEALMGASSEPLWDQALYLSRSLAASFAPLCKLAMRVEGVDPAAFVAAASLSKAAPDLHAAIEAWQLQALATAPAEATRRPARSL